MPVLVYIFRCLVMLIVTWTGVRLIGKKSISEMTSYDLAAVMLLTTVAAEPLVFKIPSKAGVGVGAIVAGATIIGSISLTKLFYNFDAKPVIIISNGKIVERELRKNRMNIPLLLAELRVKGYHNIADVAFAVIEPDGQISVIPKSQARPIQPQDMAIPTAPAGLSLPLIIDGDLKKQNLEFSNKDEKWLWEQLMAYSVKDIKEVMLAQIDSTGQLHVDKKNEKVNIPDMI